MRPLFGRLTLALVAALVGVLAPRPVPADAGEAAWASVAVSRAWAASDDIEIDEIGKVKRGKSRVLVRADVGQSGLICQLKVKYVDGNADSPDDVLSNSRGICEIYFDVPDRQSVVGEAVAKLKVVTKKGGEKGKTARSFTVRDGRH